MMRFKIDNIGNYTLCFDSISLKWIIGNRYLEHDCKSNNNNRNLIKYFDNPHLKEGVERPEIVGISVLPTLRCNLQCIHCFYNSSPNYQKEALPRRFIPYIVDFVKHYKSIESVTIGGGEPLIWPYIKDFLTALLELTEVKIFLLTNGLLLRNFIEILKDYSDRISIQISVDAATPNTYKYVRGGNWSLLLKNIEMSAKHFETTLSYTIHRYNIEEVIEFIKLSERLNVSFLHFPVLEDWGRARDVNIYPDVNQLKSFYEFLVYYHFHVSKLKIYFVEELKQRLLLRAKRYNCSAAFRQIAIGPDGYIYPCSELIATDFRISFIRKWQEIPIFLQKFRRKTGIGTPIVDIICKDCPVRYLCGGGCRAVDFLSGKNYVNARQNQLVCEILQENFFKVIWEISNPYLSVPLSTEDLYNNKETQRFIRLYHE